MYKLFYQLLLAVSCVISTHIYAAGGSEVNVEMPPIDASDEASLQRGAKYFVNYCSGCHSLDYLRFNRLAKDAGITDAKGNILEGIVQKDLIFGDLKIGDPLTIAMTKEEAKKWFGVVPPDLTLETRLRGPEWVYGFLTSFYLDPKAQWGVNNLVYPGTAMPNILGALQGEQKPVYKTMDFKTDFGSAQEQEVIGIEPAILGQLSPEEFDKMVYDIVNFLAYAAEPGKAERYRVGFYVLLFIIVFTLFAYLLKREYWKDVHKH